MEIEQLNKSGEWWKHAKYTGRIRQRKIWLLTKLFGLTRSEKQSPYINYFKSKEKQREYRKLFQAVLKHWGLKLDQSSKIFEPGCNCGRNLKVIHDQWGCYCQGADISELAVQTLKEKVFNKIDESKIRVHLGNILTTDYLDGFKDDYFDVALTYGFLMHLPKSDAKARLIASLKRIARHVVLVEWNDPKKYGQVDFAHEDEYCISFENYQDYGFQYFPASYYNKRGMGVYIFKK